MGSSISAIYDDYETYEYICELTNTKPLDIRAEKSFYTHGRELVKNMSEEVTKKCSNYYWYNKFK